DKPERPPVSSWYGGSVGFHTYHILLWISNYIPRILPAIEWFVFGMQYGFSDNAVTSGIEPQRTGLLMNCLYSQFVNEWALPLEKGPEAITRMSAWINGEEGSGIPFSNKGLYVHAPVEVRVSDTSRVQPRPWMDNTNPNGPTLYLNATLYRPFLKDPPCHERYYEAFEYLMKELGGKPHWAKNFSTVTHDDLQNMFGDNLTSFLRVRNEVDPDGVFLGAWHRRYLLPADTPRFACEEREFARTKAADGGKNWFGDLTSHPRTADEKTALLSTEQGPNHDDLEDARRFRETSAESLFGTKVFDKM
ncbi:L-gulonolactone/D-arabinono-1,4-lactone oxidase, partial [Aureobasidium melanogenum]